MFRGRYKYKLDRTHNVDIIDQIHVRLVQIDIYVIDLNRRSNKYQVITFAYNLYLTTSK